MADESTATYNAASGGPQGGYSGAFFGPAWNAYMNLEHQSHQDDPARATNDLQSYGDRFASMFQNFVGRAPNGQELSDFYNQVIAPRGSFPDQTELSNKITDFINTHYQQAAQDQVTSQLQAQQSQAQSLADTFRTQGKQAISDTENQLMDYQNRLFDRLRPQLITSLQAQGLLNTGGLNEAMAGAQQDLAASAQGYLADANLQNENAANQIAFGGASAPYYYQQSQLLNKVPYLQQMGQTALDNGNQMLLNNQNYQLQSALLNQQASLQKGLRPSFGQNIGNTFSSGLGTSLGSNLGSWFGPGTQGQQNSAGQMGMSPLRSLFA